jgi:hypothetical protein
VSELETVIRDAAAEAHAAILQAVEYSTDPEGLGSALARASEAINVLTALAVVAARRPNADDPKEG